MDLGDSHHEKTIGSDIVNILYYTQDITIKCFETFT